MRVAERATCVWVGGACCANAQCQRRRGCASTQQRFDRSPRKEDAAIRGIPGTRSPVRTHRPPLPLRADPPNPPRGLPLGPKASPSVRRRCCRDSNPMPNHVQVSSCPTVSGASAAVVSVSVSTTPDTCSWPATGPARTASAEHTMKGCFAFIRFHYAAAAVSASSTSHTTTALSTGGSAQTRTAALTTRTAEGGLSLTSALITSQPLPGSSALPLLFLLTLRVRLQAVSVETEPALRLRRGF